MSRVIPLGEAFREAFAHETSGRDAQALAIYERILAAVPNHPGALLRIAGMELRRGDRGTARARLELALDAARQMQLPVADILLTLALVLEEEGDLAAARDAISGAVNAPETSAAAWEHAARMAWRANDLAAARALCGEAVARFPGNPAILHQQGIVAKLGGRIDDACRVLAQAVALEPDDAGLRVTLGAALIDARRSGEALQHLERAIALGAASGEAWDNLGLARLACGDHEGAQHAFEEAVRIAPRLVPALANLVHLRQQHCVWDGLAELEHTLAATLDDETSDPRWPPFIALAMDFDAGRQLAVARRWSRTMLPAAAAPKPAHPRGSRWRIGYLGNDFREHAMGRLMAGLFEAHDRSAFELFAYSYARDDESALQRRLRAAFEHWHELPEASDADIAQRIRDDGIDILIECKGHTRGGRLGILASRPAPVQLHYMGFPGSLGYDAIDGIIADATVIPRGDEEHFHERVFRLPRCYFVNDWKRDVPVADDRARHGLPAHALVLACFNQPYKITRGIFAIWMQALRAAPDALLWLLATSDMQQRNLREEARRAGTDPDRIVFAPPMTQAAHMARVGCADLALDTLPVNQHTTACDALWAGVPMITLRGQTFAGRVGASVLHAAQLDDLVTDAPEHYAARLLELVNAPDRLARYGVELKRQRDALPLFDTNAFARDWEALLVRAYEETLATRELNGRAG